MSNIYSRFAFVCLVTHTRTHTVCRGAQPSRVEHSTYAKHKHKQEIHFSFVCPKFCEVSRGKRRRRGRRRREGSRWRCSACIMNIHHTPAWPSRALIMLKLRHRFRGIYDFVFFFFFEKEEQPNQVPKENLKFQQAKLSVQCAAGQKIERRNTWQKKWTRKRNATQFSLAGSVEAVRRPLAKRPGYHKTCSPV